MRVLFRSHLARGGLMGEWTPIEWLALVEHELLLFAAVFFLIGALDEFAVALAWLWLRLVANAETLSIDRAEVHARPLSGPAAVLVPPWREPALRESNVAHPRGTWPPANHTI